MDKNFADLLYKHAKNSRIAVLTVATNGTILPNNEIMKAMKETGAMFRISDYGSLSSQKMDILDKSRAFHVPCELYPRAKEWYAFSNILPFGRSQEENLKIQKKCFFGTKDLMFYGNHFYCCCKALYADACEIDSPAVCANSLNLDSDFGLAELEQIVHGHNLHLMCDYCDFPMKTIKPAEQLPRNGIHHKS